MEIKSPYLTSVAKNSHLTNKLETDVALIYPIPPPSLLSICVPFNGYLKLLQHTRKRKKLKEGFVVTPRNRTRTNQLC